LSYAGIKMVPTGRIELPSPGYQPDALPLSYMGKTGCTIFYP
jgi:hypothetical protein